MKWIGPYLLVPVLLIASLLIESKMQESGFIAYIPVGLRSSYSIWRVIMLSALVGTPVTALFMADAWKSTERSVSFYNRFFGSLMTAFLFSFLPMVAFSFALLVPLTVPAGFIASNIFPQAAVVAFWVASAGFLCSSITSGPGAAVLSAGLLSLGLFPGLAGSSMDWWFAGPLGEMVYESPGASLAVMGHGIFYLLFSLLILRKTNR